MSIYDDLKGEADNEISSYLGYRRHWSSTNLYYTFLDSGNLPAYYKSGSDLASWIYNGIIPEYLDSSNQDQRGPRSKGSE